MSNSKHLHKKFVLGQYFTKEDAVERSLKLLFKYKKYPRDIPILEPAFGTGNFIRVLKSMGFVNIDGCEIDSEFTDKPSDFFLLPLDKKYKLIIGNPPFTKYNVKQSYYYVDRYKTSSPAPGEYLPSNLVRKGRLRIENAFILKSIKHLKDTDSTIGFVLPISFFIKGKNNTTKQEILKHFSTIIIYQDNKVWFDYEIPCSFAIFTDISDLPNKVVLIYEKFSEEGSFVLKTKLDKQQLLTEELIPNTYFYRQKAAAEGVKLSEFLSGRIKYKKSYTKNNINAGNILDHATIPSGANVAEYALAVCRVGNASVGRAGLINLKTDILNDMFYVFGFNEKYAHNKQIKEDICNTINRNQEYFKNITMRVGSKSIKKEDILNYYMSHSHP